jgi:hypothetical protein
LLNFSWILWTTFEISKVLEAMSVNIFSKLFSCSFWFAIGSLLSFDDESYVLSSPAGLTELIDYLSKGA